MVRILELTKIRLGGGVRMKMMNTYSRGLRVMSHLELILTSHGVPTPMREENPPWMNLLEVMKMLEKWGFFMPLRFG
jgi:hypothetical protein